MQYTRLGKSDLLVSRICMGCMGFGDPSTGQHRWTLDETASRDIIRHALEQGINFYDTAIAYQNGSSERYVGRALREMAKREEVVLATKFLPRTAAQIAEGISGKQAIARSLDQSLRNLGMDYIDLYIYHIWDYNTPRAVAPNGIVENEVCPVYAARVVSEVQPNDDEVMDYQWVDLATMLSALAATPWAFSPWMVLEAENRDARQALTDFVARLRG